MLLNLFNPMKAFIYADNQFDYQLKRQSNIIFLLVGFVTELNSIFTDISRSYLSSEFHTLLVVISAIIGFMLIRFLLVPILYFMGKALNSRAEFIDVRIILAYSLIPQIILILPLELYLGMNDLKTNMTDSMLLTANMIRLVTVIWSFYIMLTGFVYFGKFSRISAIINMSPLILLQAIPLIFHSWFMWQS